MTDNPICRGCPGALLGICDDCSVHAEDEERDDHDIESYDPDFIPDEGEGDNGDKEANDANA